MANKRQQFIHLVGAKTKFNMEDGEKCIWEKNVENNLVIQTKKLMSPIKETKRVKNLFETKNKGLKNRKMFQEPLEKLKFDLIVWKWAIQEKLMRYKTKHIRKMLKPNR